MKSFFIRNYNYKANNYEDLDEDLQEEFLYKVLNINHIN